MARKNLLKSLLADPAETPRDGAAAEPPALPAGAIPDPARELAPDPARAGRGAIGAVSRGIADLKARAVVDLEPSLIDEGGVTDRLEHDPEDHARLLASLRDHGQQVPVLVRPHPLVPGRYQIAYGRRRLRALRDLGRPVKALVRDLDDLGLLLAQGQENTARRDLSFMEKANFARQMVAAGHERTAVCDALSVDKTTVSRMLSVIDRVPLPLIEAIGPAPGIGRNRWLALADLCATAPVDEEEARALLAASPNPLPSDARFEAIEAWLRSRSRPAAPGGTGPRPASREALHTRDGHPLAEITRRPGALTLTLRSRDLDGFDTWLAASLPDLHARWHAERTTEGAEAPES